MMLVGSSNVKSVKSVIGDVCKIGEVHVIRKDRVKPGTSISMWWNVVHAKDSVLADLETTCDQVNVQTGWKLELCFMGESSPSPLAEVGMEHQSVSKKTSEGLSSQLALSMAPLNATSTGAEAAAKKWRGLINIRDLDCTHVPNF